MNPENINLTFKDSQGNLYNATMTDLVDGGYPIDPCNGEVMKLAGCKVNNNTLIKKELVYNAVELLLTKDGNIKFVLSRDDNPNRRWTLTDGRKILCVNAYRLAIHLFLNDLGYVIKDAECPAAIME